MTPSSGRSERDSRHQRVTAIIWTYNRFAVAEACVQAVLGQTRQADHVILVDSASPDGTAALARQRFPQINVIELADNGGPGPALIAALELTSCDPPDHYWLIEDDSRPGPDCLERALTYAAQLGTFGMLGPDGAHIKRGQWYPQPSLEEVDALLSDFVYLDGALLSSEVVSTIGLPRADFFMMAVDVEYALRIARAGFGMFQVGLPYQSLRLGSKSPDGAWRAYYQSRNHLRMAIDLRSGRLLLGFGIRTSKHIVYSLLHSDWEVLTLRLKGIRDALRGHMGRTLEPA